MLSQTASPGDSAVSRPGAESRRLRLFTPSFSVLFAVWAVWQHGLPEFSKVGIIWRHSMCRRRASEE